MTENQDHQRYTIVVGAGVVIVEDVLTDHPPVIFQGQDRLIKAVDYCDRMNNHPDQETLQRIRSPRAFLAAYGMTQAAEEAREHAREPELPDWAEMREITERKLERITVRPAVPASAASFLADELPAFAAWQRDRARRLTEAREVEEEAHRAYVSAVAQRVVIETEMPPLPAERDSEPRSQVSPPSVGTGPGRCSCGVSAGMAHDCETASRIS